MKSLRTPLGRVLGRGSAKEGTDHWWTQRVSAVALALLGLWFAASLLMLPSLGIEPVTEWLARPWNAVLMLLLVLTLAVHSDLGVQVVVEDYVHHPFLKVATLIVLRFLHVLLAAAAIVAVLKIAVGTSE